MDKVVIEECWVHMTIVDENVNFHKTKTFIVKLFSEP